MIHALNQLVMRQIPIVASVSTGFRMQPEIHVVYTGDSPEILQLIEEFNSKAAADLAGAVRLVFSLAKNYL